jgi:hypothetical protein
MKPRHIETFIASAKPFITEDLAVRRVERYKVMLERYPTKED